MNRSSSLMFSQMDKLTCAELLEAVSIATYDKLFLLTNFKRCEVFFEETEDYYQERFEDERDD